jgi:hypothetical protein
MKKLIPTIIVIIFLLLNGKIAYAQAPDYDWAKLIGGAGFDMFGAVAVDELGNSYIAGKYNNTITLGTTTLTSNLSSSNFIAKMDSNGSFIWARGLEGTSINNDGFRIIYDGKGSLFFSGNFNYDLTLGATTLYNNNSPVWDYTFIAKLDTNGNFIWANSYHNTCGSCFDGTFITFDQSGNVYIGGSSIYYITINNTAYPTPSSNNSLDIFLIKLDINGDFSWIKFWGGIDDDYVQDVKVDSLGNICILGLFDMTISFDSVTLYDTNGNGYHDGFITKLDPDGNCIWAKRINSQNYTHVYEFDIDNFGNIYILGNGLNGILIGSDTIVHPVGNEGRFIAKLNSNGNTLWVKGIDDQPYEFARSYAGNFILFVTLAANPTSSNNYFAKLDSLGNLLWTKPAPYLHASNFLKDLIIDKFENIYLGETLTKDSVTVGGNTLYTNGGFDIQLTKLGNAPFIVPNTPTALLKGKLYNDLDSNCVDALGEPVLPNKIVKTSPGGYYGVADATGHYEIIVPVDTINTTNYAVHALPVTNLAYQAIPICPTNNTQNINVGTVSDTIAGIDFGYQISSCHHLEVEIASNRRRRCFTNTTTVQYKNTGSQIAANAYVMVVFPNYVIPISSSAPWLSINDSTIQFNLGNIAPGQSGSIYLTDSVKCDDPSILGLAQCTKASIYPAPNCPNVNWNGAALGITGNCVDGAVLLDIFNQGIANMSDSINYKIYLDSVLIDNAKVKLNAGDTLHLGVNANGSSVHVVMDQVLNHPTESFITYTVEACSSDSLIIPTAYVNHFPLAQSANSKTHCLPIIDSFDPNDKQVFPIGFTNNHIIAPNTPLEFLIRFQNTGTDTAFNVSIEDELSQHLNPGTIEFGASSHNYQVTMQTNTNGTTTLDFKFNNINLPDSNVNLLASQGFVQFRISPKDSLPLGTVVLNTAHIYFDFNMPVFTNQTKVTYDNILFVDSTLNGAVQLVPGTPTLIYPLNTAIDLAPNVNFDWTDAANATGYVIEYALLSDMSNAMITNSTTSSIPVNNLILGNTYYWRVKAQNGLAIFSNWSNVYSFTVVAPLAAPALIYPAQLSSNIPTSITFDWDDIPNAIDYIITYDTSASFATAMIDSVSISEYASTALIEGTIYYWKVKAKDAFGFYSPWTSTYEFTTIQNVTAPTLIYPSDLSSNIPTLVTFDWSDIPFATWYQLEYDIDSNFTTAQGDTSVLSEYQLASNLNDLTTYYWHVKSFNGNSISSAWSSTYSFTTDFTTGINKKTDNKILIYPNPAHDGISITLPEIDDVQIEISDLSGRLVLSEKVIQQSNIYLPLNLAQGMYHIVKV